MSTIITRIGHIGDDDNRFLGRSVVHDLVYDMDSLSDTFAMAFGIGPLDADDRFAIHLHRQLELDGATDHAILAMRRLRCCEASAGSA